MHRRSFLGRTSLGGAAAATLGRRGARAQTAATLRYVPQADLAVIDPVMTTAYITRVARGRSARLARRRDITGIIPGQFVFWNVRKA